MVHFSDLVCADQGSVLKCTFLTLSPESDSEGFGVSNSDTEHYVGGKRKESLWQKGLYSSGLVWFGLV